jgi:putative Mg2+ transporter-C (MgtC) family protein
VSADVWEWLALDAPSLRETVRIAARLVLATLLAGCVGFERERRGKTAGLRTHMLVGLGSAAFTMAILEAGGGGDALSRVIQGIATGIGFVGAGAILKPEGVGQVKGLTTATGVWLTAALGTCVGAGRFWLPVMATLLALIVMAILGRFERKLTGRDDDS